MYTIVIYIKKSKCDYRIENAPTEEQIAAIENRVNEIIQRNMIVSAEYVDRDNIPSSIDLSKLPEDVSQTLRLVSVGDYDICACIGEHVENTSEIGTFKILSHDYADGRLRLRFKLIDA
ncbi:hypothetical protein D0T87_22955 [Bacteroides sp. 51]|nr:hypothetical protein [Bacteroides sp. 51]